jgi:hypothetical protein
VASFIVWLARQRPTGDERRCCPERLDRFLRWQHQQHDQDGESDEAAYYEHLSQGGASDFQLKDARAAIGLFGQYLLAATDDSEPPASRLTQCPARSPRRHHQLWAGLL